MREQKYGLLDEPVPQFHGTQEYKELKCNNEVSKDEKDYPKF